MREWIQSVVACACIVTMLLHLIPEGKFLKYVKFYSGLLLLLAALKPVLDFLGKDGELSRLVGLEILKEEVYDMETSVKGMAQLKNDALLSAFRQEICRQVEEIASIWGASAENIAIVFDGEDAFRIQELSFFLNLPKNVDASVSEEIQNEIQGLYLLERGQIHIEKREGQG